MKDRRRTGFRTVQILLWTLGAVVPQALFPAFHDAALVAIGLLAMGVLVFSVDLQKPSDLGRGALTLACALPALLPLDLSRFWPVKALGLLLGVALARTAFPNPPRAARTS